MKRCRLPGSHCRTVSLKVSVCDDDKRTHTSKQQNVPTDSVKTRANKTHHSKKIDYATVERVVGVHQRQKRRCEGCCIPDQKQIKGKTSTAKPTTGKPTLKLFEIFYQDEGAEPRVLKTAPTHATKAASSPSLVVAPAPTKCSARMARNAVARGNKSVCDDPSGLATLVSTSYQKTTRQNGTSSHSHGLLVQNSCFKGQQSRYRMEIRRTSSSSSE